MVDHPSLCVGHIVVNAGRKRKRGNGHDRHKIGSTYHRLYFSTKRVEKQSLWYINDKIDAKN